MKSCIYKGQVRHRRTAPAANEFQYGLFMMYLDLEELDHVFDGRWLWSTKTPNLAWFRRADHLGDCNRPLAACVRDLVARETGDRPDGPIGLLTHLRYFGYGFNPVSFYYCYDSAGEQLKWIVSEVNNTPWGERHCYVHDVRSNETVAKGVHRIRLNKQFHVSPFMPMDIEYDWRFSAPGERLSVHMENHHNGRKMFDATMIMQRAPLSGTALAGVLIRYPLLTFKVIAAIYYQAGRLWLKRVPFFTHPGKIERSDTSRGPCHES